MKKTTKSPAGAAASKTQRPPTASKKLATAKKVTTRKTVPAPKAPVRAPAKSLLLKKSAQVQNAVKTAVQPAMKKLGQMAASVSAVVGNVVHPAPKKKTRVRK